MEVQRKKPNFQVQLISTNNIAGVSSLLDGGYDVNSIPVHVSPTTSILGLCVIFEKFEMFKMLISRGANVFLNSKTGNMQSVSITPLQCIVTRD